MNNKNNALFHSLSLPLTLSLPCTSTSQTRTLRGSIPEDSVPSSSKHGGPRGLPLKDVLEYILPELSTSCLRLASSAPAIPDLLLQLDQQGVNTTATLLVL